MSRETNLVIGGIALLALVGIIQASGSYIASSLRSVNTAQVENATPEGLSNKPPFPDIALDKMKNGEEAIMALGDKLPEVARWYNMSAGELSDHLKKDKTLHIDKKGRLLYKDDNIISKEQAAAAGNIPGTGFTQDSLLPLEQTFSLHSRPGSTKTIYLDFNGHFFKGGTSAWTGDVGGADLNAPAWDIDGSPSTFGQTEREYIQLIWQRMAEDYAPFDVDVTTEEPSLDKLARSGSSDQIYGNRVLFSPMSHIFGAAGGYSYVGVFDDTSENLKVSLVFPEQLANYHSYMAECGSHENGHAVGLNHVTSSIQGGNYYYGHADWAPIMGSGYYRPVTTWTNGDFDGSSGPIDQIASIVANGLPLIADDYGNTRASATAISAVNNTLSAGGFIERDSDVDYFSFVTETSGVTLNLNVATLAPNLNAEISLYDANGGLIMTDSPGDKMSASIATNLAAGTYYLSVTGVGSGDPKTLSGYSGYSSLGQYYISGSITSNNNNPPTVTISASPTSGSAPLTVQFSSNASDPEGTPVTYAWSLDGNTFSTEPNASYTFTTNGTHSVVLSVTDGTGLSSLKSVQITLNNPAPVAQFSATPSSGGAPLTVNFNASASTDANGSIASYNWNFGNGLVGTGAQVTHTYGSLGTYTATLTVTDNEGATATKSSTITVADVNAIAAPSNLKAASQRGYVTLTWSDNSNNESGFYLERAVQVRKGTPVYQRIAVLGQNVKTYVDTAAPDTYYYRVQAYNAITGRTSPYSAVVSGRIR
jgi:PKD repeat protein